MNSRATVEGLNKMLQDKFQIATPHSEPYMCTHQVTTKRLSDSACHTNPQRFLSPAPHHIWATASHNQQYCIHPCSLYQPSPSSKNLRHNCAQHFSLVSAHFHGTPTDTRALGLLLRELCHNNVCHEESPCNGVRVF